jgi:hypothetical protein
MAADPAHAKEFKMRPILVVAGLAATIAAALFLLVTHSSSPPAQAAFIAKRMDTRLATGGVPQVHAREVVDGQPWSVKSFTNPEGQICAGETVPNDGGEGGQGLTCRDPNSMFSNGPLVYFVGSRQLPGPSHLKAWDNVWIWGWAAGQVATVDLQLTNCRAIRLPIDSGRIFFHVFGAETIHGGLGPQNLIARAADGTVLETAQTPLDPASTPQARAAGARAPRRTTC